MKIKIKLDLKCEKLRSHRRRRKIIQSALKHRNISWYKVMNQFNCFVLCSALLRRIASLFALRTINSDKDMRWVQLSGQACSKIWFQIVGRKNTGFGCDLSPWQITISNGIKIIKRFSANLDNNVLWPCSLHIIHTWKYSLTGGCLLTVSTATGLLWVKG